MADWTRRVRVTRTIEYEVPAREPLGACWTEVDKALYAATQEYKRSYGRDPSDDAIRAHVGDDAITLVFELTAAMDPELFDRARLAYAEAHTRTEQALEERDR